MYKKLNSGFDNLFFNKSIIFPTKKPVSGINMQFERMLMLKCQNTMFEKQLCRMYLIFK